MAGHADADPAGDTHEVTVEHRVGREVIWRSGDLERLVYHYTTDEQKAFVHPLRTGQGTLLTDFRPADHPWHRGLWFAWKYLNGINFWEEWEGSAGTGRHGRVVFAGIDDLVRRAEWTTITTTYGYQDPTGLTLLEERRTVRIGLPPAGSCTIDWDAMFTAVAGPVCLDRTVITPEAPWGGYAGLSFRGAADWRAIRGLNSEGHHDRGLKNKRARWVQMSGAGGDGRRASLAILDHPGNPRYPSFWYYGDDIDPLGFPFLNPSLVLAAPYNLDAGETVRLRYRIFAQDQEHAAAVLDDQHAAFAAGHLPVPVEAPTPDTRRQGPSE